MGTVAAPERTAIMTDIDRAQPAPMPANHTAPANPGTPALVYTIDNCSYCEAVKRLFKSAGIGYEERRIRDFDEIRALKDRYAWRTFPMVLINGTFIGGYDDTRAAQRSGKLDELLRA